MYFCKPYSSLVFFYTAVYCIKVANVLLLCKQSSVTIVENTPELKGAVGSADLKISKSALLSLNHHNFSNTKPIYAE